MSQAISIESQVILKEAAETVRQNTAAGVTTDLEAVALDLAEAFIAVQAKLNESAPDPVVSKPQGGGATQPAPSQGGGGVTIKNPGKAPAGEPDVPEWLASQAAAAGVSGPVWDNRADLPQFGGDRNPKSPWFKAVDGGAGIWPPR